MAIHLVDVVVCPGSEFDRGHILQPQHLAVGQRLDDHVFIVCLMLVTAAVFQHILKRVLRFGAQGSSRSLDVLFVEHGGDVRRHQSVFLHLGRVEPDAHRVFVAEDVHLAYAGNTRQARFDVDLHVVGQKSLVERVVGAVYGQLLDVARLALAHSDAALRDFGRQQSLRRGDAVLDVDRRHVGVGPLAEEDRNLGRTVVRRRGGHVHHVLHAVERLLQRYDDTLLYGLGIGTGIGGRNADGRGCDFGELLDGQLRKTDEPHDKNHHRDDSGQNGPFDKGADGHRAALFSDSSPAAGVICIPSCSSPAPSATMTSPTSSPDSTM